MAYRTFDAGGYHSIALDGSGNAFTWGCNCSGEIGNGTYGTSLSSPYQVTGHQFVEVAAGNEASFGLKADGSLYSWGANHYGQLGVGDTTNRASPTVVKGSHTFVRVSTSKKGNHTVAIDTDGNVWCWGAGEYYQLGNNATTAQNHTPFQLTLGTVYIDVACGAYHTIALDEDGHVWGWGSNEDYGQLGETNYLSFITVPTVIDGVSVYTAIAAAQQATFLLKGDGTLWAVGNKAHLGINDTGTTTAIIQCDDSHSWSQIVASYCCALAQTTTGAWYAWGQDYGECGLSTTGTYATPQVAPYSFDAISLGVGHGLAKAGEYLYASGDNSEGQLGDGTTTDHFVFEGVGIPFAPPPAGEIPLLETAGVGYAMPSGYLPPLFVTSSGTNSTEGGTGAVSLKILTASGTGHQAIIAQGEMPSFSGTAKASIGVQASGELPAFIGTSQTGARAETSLLAFESSSLAYSGRLLSGEGELPSFEGASLCGAIQGGELPSVTGVSTVSTTRNLNGDGLLPSLSGSSTVTTGRVLSVNNALPALTGMSSALSGRTLSGAGTLPTLAGTSAITTGAVGSMTGVLPSLVGSSSGYANANITHSVELPALKGSSYITTSRFASTILRYMRPT